MAEQYDALLRLATDELSVEQITATAQALLAASADLPFQERVEATRDAALARHARELALANQVRHFSAAQRISHVGSYDFEIATDTNVWSDQLYRIYGREPQSFMATYEKFLERGEVVADAGGTPTRMVGICWDITEQKEIAAALARSSERFERLIESAPDVVLVVGHDGTILQANDRVRTVLGWDPAEVVGQPVTELLPAGLGPGGPPLELVASHRDGTEIPAEVSASHVETDGGAVTAAFVRDRRDRKRSEELALRLHDADVRRRHAIEINDNVVQGLASVLYLLDLERYSSAHNAARRTMATARAMMDDLLEDTGPAGLAPGELVRGEGHAATLDEVVPPAPPAPAGALRVVLADDAEDIRLLLRLNLSSVQGVEVVGEAGDGVAAVRLAEELQPDVLLLDLSMPVMDGLQAIPELRRVSPQTRIVVLSGFDGARMKPVAIELGADAYLEKGEAMSALVATLAAIFPEHTFTAADAQPADPEAPDDGGLAFDGDMVVHELRTPLTVITGMLSTLRERMDVLPSATTHELLDAAGRNARQMAELLDAVSDARRAQHGLLPVVPEQTDLGKLVQDAVADVVVGHGMPRPVVIAEPGVDAPVDPMRIRQVLSNLLSNAFKFSPPNTPVTVTVTSSDENVEITVHDEGPGIPDERRDELFSKFGRLGQTGHGMGLGLYISRAIARAHSGDLELRDGPGATFALTLPRRRVGQPAES